MAVKSNYDIAEEYARRVSPPPKHDPLPTGVLAAIAAGVAVMAFKMFAGLDLEAFTVPTILTIAAAFIVTSGFLWVAQKRYIKTLSNELGRLQERDNAKRS